MPVKTIPSPIPGIFYRKPAPDQPPFKAEGDAVSPGDTLGLVEVMKTFTPLTTTETGRIVRFLVEDEDEVMPGQPVCEIEAEA